MQQPGHVPTPPQAQAPQITVPGPNGTTINIPVPMSRAEVNALFTRRNELSTQLSSAQGRRDALAQQLQDPKAVDVPGLNARIAQLDARILGIENDIAENGRALASIPANSRHSTGPSIPITAADLPAILSATGMLTVALLLPFGAVWARRLWRGERAASLPAVSPRWEENFARMARLEDAVGAIATEIERVTDGQRFLTHVLSAGEGEYQPIAARQRDADPVPRSTQ